jgi:hypothetical protein
MYPDDPACYCTKCSVLHMENCNLCYGFGLKHGGLPVRAAETRFPEVMLIRWHQCPLCEGTPYGPAGSLLRTA